MDVDRQTKCAAVTGERPFGYNASAITYEIHRFRNHADTHQRTAGPAGANMFSLVVDDIGFGNSKRGLSLVI